MESSILNNVLFAMPVLTICAFEPAFAFATTSALDLPVVALCDIHPEKVISRIKFLCIGVATNVSSDF